MPTKLLSGSGNCRFCLHFIIEAQSIPKPDVNGIRKYTLLFRRKTNNLEQSYNQLQIFPGVAGKKKTLLKQYNGANYLFSTMIDIQPSGVTSRRLDTSDEFLGIILRLGLRVIQLQNLENTLPLGSGSMHFITDVMDIIIVKGTVPNFIRYII